MRAGGGGCISGCLLLFTGKWACNWGNISGGERGLISGEGDLWLDASFCCCFRGKWTCNWGNLYVGGGGLITGCIVLFTGKWDGNSVGLLFSWAGEAHKRKFTLFTTRDTYNSTH